MELRQVEALVAVADEGRCATAARRLGISRSALTERLDRLERTAGERLVHRSPREVGLTAVGTALLPAARRMAAAAAELREDLAAASELRRGSVRVVATSERWELAVRFVSELRRRLPGWTVSLRVVPWREARRALDAGDAEVGLGPAIIGVPRGSPYAHVRPRPRVGRELLVDSGRRDVVAWRWREDRIPCAEIVRTARRLARRQRSPAQ